MRDRRDLVYEVLAEHVVGGFDDGSALFEDLGLSSLRMMQVLGELRNRYGLVIDLRQCESILTVGDLVDSLRCDDD